MCVDVCSTFLLFEHAYILKQHMRNSWFFIWFFEPTLHLRLRQPQLPTALRAADLADFCSSQRDSHWVIMMYHTIHFFNQMSFFWGGYKRYKSVVAIIVFWKRRKETCHWQLKTPALPKTLRKSEGLLSCWVTPADFRGLSWDFMVFLCFHRDHHVIMG